MFLNDNENQVKKKKREKKRGERKQTFIRLCTNDFMQYLKKKTKKGK